MLKVFPQCIYGEFSNYQTSKTYLYTSDKAGFSSNKKYNSYKCWTCAELFEAFSFLMKTYVQFEDISNKTNSCFGFSAFEDVVYQQIVGILTGTNCAPFIVDLFLFCYEKDFMSNIHKSKQYGLIDIFNDTSRYLDEIFTIDKTEFEKHIPDIYISNGTTAGKKQILQTKKFLSLI